MIPLIQLPADDLCRVIVDTASIYSDGYVLERIAQAQKSMGEEPTVSDALSAFSSLIAPALICDRHRNSTISILKSMGGDADEEAGTMRDLFHLVLIDPDYANLVATIRRHGAGKVISAVYKYGTPPVMDMLTALLNEQAEHEGWQTYIADTCVAMLRAFTGRSKIPFYSDITRKDSHQYDSRSGKEIIADIVEKRKRKKGKQKHEDL